MTELGKRLKEARLEKGISIEELQEITKIQKRYLIGIEEGDYSMMPGPFYVRAFIKQYTEAVGLDTEEIFEQYKSDIPSTYREDLPEQLSRVQSRKSVPVRDSKFLDMLPRVLIIAIVIGALFLVWYLLPNFTGDDTTDQTEKKGGEEIHFEQSDKLTDEPDEEEPADDDESDEEGEGDEDGTNGEEGAGEEKKMEINVVESSGKNTVYEVKNADEVELKIVATGKTWITLRDSERKALYNNFLIQGEENESISYDFTNESEAFIVVGDSSATEIYINDELVEFVVSPSDQVRQDITIRFVKDSEDETNTEEETEEATGENSSETEDIKDEDVEDNEENEENE